MTSSKVTRRKSPLEIFTLGILQIVSWGASFYLLGVLAEPITRDTGWSPQWVLGGASIGLLVAGLCSPICGRLIARIGGRKVLTAHALILGFGLWLLALAPSLPFYVFAWAVIGLAMCLGLYDALFTSLGSSYGLEARPIIVGITLISGFCTTLMWPLLGYIEHLWGWRSTCGLMGTVAFFVLCPGYRYALADQAAVEHTTRSKTSDPAAISSSTYWLMTIIFAIAATIMTCISVLLLTLLQARGYSLGSAIALAALIGPAQVMCRILDLFFKSPSATVTALLSGGLTALGLSLINFTPQFIVFGILCYGAGNGLRAIVKSTLPLTVLKPQDYAVISGRMTRPTMLAQAAAPISCGYVISTFGTEPMMHILTALGILGVMLTLILAKITQRSRST